MNKISLNLVQPNNYPVFRQKKQVEIQKKMNQLYAAEGALVVVSAAAFLAYRGYSKTYKVKLAKDLSKELGKKISKRDLEAVMTKKEMLKELPKLTEQNYVASAENIKNGTFLADLHSHSNFSDGTIKVEDLLNEAAEYGDKLNKINGKKFIFALSDHDGVEGVKEALKLIAQNPDKYKNIKFLPASELSFIIHSHPESPRFSKFKSEVQMPEMLVYNINPFSEETKSFFERIYSNRKSQVSQAIKDSCFLYHTADFKDSEYTKYFNPQNKFCFLNQHWKIWNYLHLKSRIVQMAKEQGKNADTLFQEIMEKLSDKTPGALSCYIEKMNIKTKSVEIDERIKKWVIPNIFPKVKGESLVESDFEMGFKDLVKFAKKENAILGFAHPAFTMENFKPSECFSKMNELISLAKGRVKFIEKYHQAYPIGDAISQSDLEHYNKIVDKLNLINIGGRDNHKKKFLP